MNEPGNALKRKPPAFLSGLENHFLIPYNQQALLVRVDIANFCNTQYVASEGEVP